MTLDCTLYRQTMDNKTRMIKNQLERGVSPNDVASNLSMATMCPIAVCVLYMMLPEVHGTTPELEKSAKMLIEFYRYDKVIPY